MLSRLKIVLVLKFLGLTSHSIVSLKILGPLGGYVAAGALQVSFWQNLSGTLVHRK